MMKKLLAAVAVTLTAGAANAALIDFTDTTVWMNGSSTAVVGAATVSLSGTGGTVRQPSSGAPGPIGPLVGLSDGLGVNNDEISAGQSITVTFSAPVLVTGLFFLDTFTDMGSSDLETAVATFSGGEIVTVAATSSTGFGFVSGFFAPILTTSITFTPDGNDGIGESDIALAGIQLAPIPLPASGWMFILSLAGLGLLGRRAAVRA